MKISDIRIGVIPALALLLAGVLIGALLPFPELGRQANLDQAEESADAAALAEAAENSEERIWKLYREREALAAQLAATEETAATAGTPPASGPPGTYTDGIYIVGRDIEPGTYDGAVTGGDSGYWARLKSTDGTVNSIIINDIATGPFVLSLKQTDRAVELRGVTLTLQD